MASKGAWSGSVEMQSQEGYRLKPAVWSIYMPKWRSRGSPAVGQFWGFSRQ